MDGRSANRSTRAPDLVARALLFGHPMVDPSATASITDTEAWSCGVALADRLSEDGAPCAERSQLAAITAYRSLEAALRCIDALPAELDRERLASSMFAALMCAYTVLDAPIRAAAHADGLREGQRLVAHAYETLRSLAPAEPSAPFDRLAEHLMEAHAALRHGAEAVARLPASAVPADFFVADTFVSDYSQG